MKKFLLSVITFMYLMASSGIAMDVHYCMGKQAGVDFYKTTEEKCGKCGMKEKKGGCCSTEYKFYKLSSDHKNVSNHISLNVVYIQGEISLFDHNKFLPFSLITPSPVNVPPDIPLPDIYIRNCVFRI